jgi:S-adenosylmethionine decarboxylase
MENQSTPIISHHTALITHDNFQDNLDQIEAFAEAIVKKLRLNIVQKISHSFEPSGTTLIYILSESHLAIHTWPEYKSIHIDLVTCKRLSSEEFKKAIEEIFKGRVHATLSFKAL